MSAPLSPFGRYRSEFSDIPGFLQAESMVLWDFFLTLQARLGISGHLLEIGVHMGKSAVLGALYMRPEELAVFVDLNFRDQARDAIQKARPGQNVFLEQRSCDILREPLLRNSAGGFRWCHIDGDHTGYSTTQDLCTAAYLVGERGIICVDDFFNFRYPQLTSAVYQFLNADSARFRMLFCGANKCYICRAQAYASYEHEIRESMAAHIRLHDLTVQLYKTSFSYDGGCFSMWLGDQQRAVYGMDENPDVIPF